ncbi:hypothetical protein SD37_10350 [Amycolatopsis orientalis]|uniref:Uncharacterized protein n=1 Tax=Amycolatopsis orientalis TaxID=31958 RepID=A0A193BUV7_AMYOR|nr:hypothetical protein [Amycolatopsis orientalis]ANN16002.1 hypothetical protein SD37_10350 [Amycolatopsis orientalis]
MSEHPPGYEAEQPVDLSKPVAYRPPPVPEPPTPARRPEGRKEKQKKAPAEAAPAAPEAVYGLVTVANVQPRTFKSTVARKLHAGLEPRHVNVRLWNGVGSVRLDGLVVADMPADPHGTDWRRQSWTADQLVIPVPDDLHAARAAWWMLDRLEAEGRPDLVSTAIVVGIQTGAHRMLGRKIAKTFAARTAEVVRVKLPGGVVPADDEARWEPLVSVVSRALKQLSSRSRPTQLSLRTPNQIVHLDSRLHGKAANQ